MSNFPIVNINGDSVETLLGQYFAVLKAAQELRNKMAHASPHGRNYQLQTDGTLYGARTEWLELMVKAKEIENWAEAHVTDLMRQAHQRMSSQKVGEIALRVMR